MTWTLSAGADITKFDLTDSGVLTFKSTRDFEDPEDGGSDNTYIVEVTVTDTGGLPDTQTLTVEIGNIDEGGEVELDTLQPLEGVDLTATLTDIDEGITATTTWHWERRHKDSSSWTTSTTTTSFSDNGEASLQTTYSPVAEDVDHFLRLTVTYTDAEAPGKEEEVESANFVLKDLVNDAPMFQDDEGAETTSVTRAVPENSPENTAVGAPVAAFDEDGDNLTYELEDPNTGDTNDILALFKIDRGSGQIRVLGDLDHEGVDEYTATVIAKDPSDGQGGQQSRDIVTVVISVTDEPEDPTITSDSGPEKIKVTETTPEATDATVTNVDADTSEDVTPVQGAILLATYQGADEDEDDPDADLRWSLTGDDAESFSYATTSQGVLTLTLKASPDYEAPADADGDNTYDVTVNLFDKGRRTATRDVAVTVENQPEMGVVTLSNAQPEVGTQITAALEDPDGGETGITWQWYWSSSRTLAFDNAGWNLIRNATSRTYTPVAGDYDAAENFLRATATYTDNHVTMDNPGTPNMDESKDMAHGVSQASVQEEPQSNEIPQFPDQDDTKLGKQGERTVPENSGAGTEVATGTPVVATDADQEELTYSLSGPDASFFTIDMYEDRDTTGVTEVPGQIRVAEGTELDYEIRKTYTVIVTATDSSGAEDMITVTINVTDLNERPFEIQKRGLTVDGLPVVSYAEDRTDAVGKYVAAGPDAVGASLNLKGDDARSFTLAPNGDLTFNTQPDFEAPGSQDGDNTYSLIVMAVMGNFEFSQPVIVTVTNVDEPGTVSITPVQATYRVDDVLSASLDEGDEEVVTGWQWARSTTAAGTFAPIGGATSDTYTIVEDDIDNFLQVTVTYDDPLGSGKTLSAVTASAVAPVPTGVEGEIVLVAPDPTVGKEITAVIRDGDGPLTNISWQWARSEDGSTGWTDIGSPVQSTSAGTGYTPVEDDAGQYLRVTVTYDDSSQTGQTADAVTSAAVKLHRYDDNSNGEIERDEVIDAINDYLFGTGTERDEVIAVINLYLFG